MDDSRADSKVDGGEFGDARRRLKALGELGLVESENVLGSRRLFYFVSREGLEFLGVDARGLFRGKAGADGA